MRQKLAWSLTLCLLAAMLLSCSQEQDIQAPRPAPAPPTNPLTAVSTVTSGKSAIAKQYLDIGRVELQLGANEAAISAFEAALQMDPNNDEAKRLLEEARQAAVQAPAAPAIRPAPIGVPVAPVIIPGNGGKGGLPLVAEPGAPPALVATPTQAAPVGCLGGEQLVFEPATAAVGDQVILTVTSPKQRDNIRLAAATPTQFVEAKDTDAGYVWRWVTTAVSSGDLRYFFYVDYNTLCASGTLTVTGRWLPLVNGLPGPGDSNVTALSVSPRYPYDKTLFAGFDGMGVFKSTNADAGPPAFRQINNGLSDPGVLALAVSPNYGRGDAVVFAGVRGGVVFRSDDAGESWSQRSLPVGRRGDVTALAVSPNFATDATVLATVDGQGVYISPDKGDNWYPMADGLRDRTVQALSISADYANDGIMFTGTRFSGIYGFGGTAQVRTLSPQPPTNLTPKTCLVTGIGADKQTLACLGVTVTVGSAADKQNYALNQPGLVIYTYQVSNLDGTLPVSNITVKDDAGTPDNLNDDVLIGTVDKLEVGESKTFTKRFYVGHQDRVSIATATGKVDFGGQTVSVTATDEALVDAPEWASINVGLEDLWIRSLAISPFYANDRTIFAGSAYGGLFKYDGKGWKQVNEGLAEKWAWIDTIVLSPRFPREPTIYVGTSSGVYRSTNGGNTWVQMRSGLPDAGIPPDRNRGVRALAISPDFANDRTVFAGFLGDYLYRVRD